MFKIIHSSAEDSLKFHYESSHPSSSNSSLKSIAITESDQLVIAIGYDNGIIELYTRTDNKTIQLIQKLDCHKKIVNALKFSSFSNTTNIILVSISEEICFWNVTIMLNNPIEPNSARSSQRFNRSRNNRNLPQITNGIEQLHLNETKITTLNGNNNEMRNDCNGNGNNGIKSNTYADILLHEHDCNNHKLNGNINPWCGKTGSSDKPELLSCIKFVGTTAEKLFINEKFDTFITIDNEGEIYYLKINNLDNRNI